jgi:hypothetical protein
MLKKFQHGTDIAKALNFDYGLWFAWFKDKNRQGGLLVKQRASFEN